MPIKTYAAFRGAPKSVRLFDVRPAPLNDSTIIAIVVSMYTPQCLGRHFVLLAGSAVARTHSHIAG